MTKRTSFDTGSACVVARCALYLSPCSRQHRLVPLNAIAVFLSVLSGCPGDGSTPNRGLKAGTDRLKPERVEILNVPQGSLVKRLKRSLRVPTRIEGPAVTHRVSAPTVCVIVIRELYFFLGGGGFLRSALEHTLVLYVGGSSCGDADKGSKDNHSRFTIFVGNMSWRTM